MPHDHLVEVTCRTIQGRLLLRPSAELNEIIIGALGRAQRVHDLILHGLVATSNHYHLLCRPRDPKQLAEVMCLVNSKIAREVGKLRGWKEKLWGRRYRAVVLTQEDEVHIDRLRYILTNGVKEGLVDRVLDWPGVHCARSLLSGEPLQGSWFDRTAEYHARRKGVVRAPSDFAIPEEIVLSPLPCWAGLTREEQRDRVQELIDHVEHGATVERASVGGRQQRSSRKRVAQILKQNPYDKPRKFTASPAPDFHGASKTLLQELRIAYRSFVATYLVAATKLRRGDNDFEFPEGSFPPALPFVRGSPRIVQQAKL